jgi:hypothetical protein
MANYSFIDPNNLANILVVEGVTDDEFTDDRERQIIVVIGRGKKVNYGTELGVTGTLTVKIRERAGVSASDQIDAFRTFLATVRPVILETPWGDQYSVDIGTLGYSRVPGTGESEAMDISVPYEQLEAAL